MILVLPILLIIVFSIYTLFPPKRINRLYGYRTSHSMQNKEIWNYANRIAAKYLLIFAIALFFFDLLLALSWPNDKTAEALSFLGLIIGLVFTIFIIEKKSGNDNPLYWLSVICQF